MTKSYAFKSNRNDPVFFAFDASTGTMAKALKGIDEDPDNPTDPKMAAIAKALSKLSPEDRDALLNALGGLGAEDDRTAPLIDTSVDPLYPAHEDPAVKAMDRALRSPSGFAARYPHAASIRETAGKAQ